MMERLGIKWTEPRYWSALRQRYPGFGGREQHQFQELIVGCLKLVQPDLTIPARRALRYSLSSGMVDNGEIEY